MRKFEELKVWQRAREVVKDIYRITSDFPSEEKFGLTSQMRRAVVSICANIAEGVKRKSDIELARFLDIADGSASEVDCLIILSVDLDFLDKTEVEPIRGRLEEITKMLHSFKYKLRHPNELKASSSKLEAVP